MTIKELLTKYGLSIAEASRRLNISYRTLQDWRSNKREPPQYVVELIEYKLSHSD